jgi:hypothetical protein
MVLNSVLILVERLRIAAMAARAMRAAMSAYSMRSCPESSVNRLFSRRLRSVIVFVLVTSVAGVGDSINPRSVGVTYLPGVGGRF